MTSVFVPIAILAALVLCYWLARERFDAVTSALAVGGVAVGGPIAWHALGPVDADFAIRLILGTVVVVLWSHLQTRLADLPAAALAVALGLAAMLPWIDGPVSVAGLTPAEGLWSSRAGLLATSPALYLGVLGWLPLRRSHVRLALAGAVLLIAVATFVTAHAAWWSRAWPSPAAFAVLTPYIVFGAAALIDRLSPFATRHPLAMVSAGLGLLVAWNITLMGVTREGGHRIGEPVSFQQLGERQARVLHGWVGHPASYPANLVYAARNRVSPAAYDVLAPLAWLGGTDRRGGTDLGGDDGLFIDSGWHAREMDGDRSFRWATDTAILRVPLARTTDVALAITLRPFEAPGSAPQQLTILVNERPQAPVTLAPGWQTVSTPVPSAAWRTGINRVTLRFANQTRPRDIGAADTRWLSAAVDTVTVEIR